MTTLKQVSLLALLVIAGCKEKTSDPAKAPAPPAAPHAATPAGPRTVSMEVTEAGFVPNTIAVKKGDPLLLKVTRTTDKTCATEILIEGTEINVPLPLGQQVEVAFTPTKDGKIAYGCAMGMMISGTLLVE